MESLKTNPENAKILANAMISVLEELPQSTKEHPFDIMAAAQVVMLGCAGLFPTLAAYKACLLHVAITSIKTMNDIPDDLVNQGKILKYEK